MNDDLLRRELIETALAAEMEHVARLPAEFHTSPIERRGEMAAWIVQRLLRAARQGDSQAIAFWRRRNHHDQAPSHAPKSSGKPRVGLLTPGLRMGGAERWILDLARYLDRERLDVAGIGIRNAAYEPTLLAKAAQAAVVMLGPEACEQLASQVDALVCWGMGELPPGAPAASVYVSHGAGACAKQWAPMVAAGRVRLAAVSRWAARVFPAKANVAIIYNGVDRQRLQPRLQRDQIRAKWGLKPGETAVGYVGRFSYEKNPAAAALAVTALGRPYRAVYVGAGAPQVVNFLKRFPCDPIILPPTEEIGDVYAALDCFVLASRSEGFSLALCEAWMCGVPTVATPVGAVPELEAEFGRLTVRVPVDPSGVELAEAVRQATAQENHAVVCRARQIAREHFTVRAMGRRWSDFVVNMLADCKKTNPRPVGSET